MSTNIRWFTDTIGATLQYTGDDDCDFSDNDFDPADADTVTRDGPWTDFFDTSEFLTFEATVAQPVVQPYIYNDELHRFRKTEDELTRAQAQIENLPWTMGHPPKDRVTDANQIRGVWTDPYWDDGQHATLHIPANDPDAVRYAVTNDEVSIGFGGTLDWADAESATYDATQRDMAYDHIASVENARCPPEKGCGLHADDLSPKDIHGHVTDSVQSQAIEEDTAGCRGGTCSDGPCSCGLHVPLSAPSVADAETVEELDLVPPQAAQNAAQTALDHREETNAMNEAVWNRAEQLAAGEELSPSDIADGADSMANWWTRHRPHTVSSDGDSLQREADNARPEDHSWIAGKGWGGIAGMNWALRMKDKIEAIRSRTSTDSAQTDGAAQHDNQPLQSTMTDTLQEFIDEQNLDVEDVIDALDVEVPTEPTAFYDGEPDIETLAGDFDAVDILVDEKERLATECDDLRTELREAQRPVFADKAQTLADLTQRWGDEDDLMAKFDAEDEEERWTVDDIEAKIDLVEDIVDEETTTVTDNADNGTDSDAESDDDPDVPMTDSGRFDLRSRTKIKQR